ncbi:hypothetical protein ATY81_00390 [Rhizobium sp. R72]|nr:hypothetical protein ATY81_00390 [Rhizobium sp. R72]OWW05553.1 hypothetical protein ATY80_00390 [Rhizobium sp. R711]
MLGFKTAMGLRGKRFASAARAARGLETFSIIQAKQTLRIRPTIGKVSRSQAKVAWITSPVDLTWPYDPKA